MQAFASTCGGSTANALTERKRRSKRRSKFVRVGYDLVWLREQRVVLCAADHAAHGRTLQKSKKETEEGSDVRKGQHIAPAGTQDMFMNELVMWKLQYGHFRIPQGMPLAAWLMECVERARAGKLDSAVLKQLRAIGALPTDEPDRDEQWEAAFASMLRLRARVRSGDLEQYLVERILERHSQDTQGKLRKHKTEQLLIWLCEQRAMWRSFAMSTEREQRFMLHLGIDLELIERQALWEDHFLHMVKYFRTHRHCRFPTSSRALAMRSGEDVSLRDVKSDLNLPDLAVWAKNQRRVARENKLLPKRRALLCALGFFSSGPVFQPRTRWRERFEQVQRVRQLFGHTDFTRILDSLGTDEHGKADAARDAALTEEELRTLRKWAWSQAVQRRKGTLSRNKVQRLQSIGFIWADGRRKARDARRHRVENQAVRKHPTWKMRVRALANFQREHGHADVPRFHPVLGSWAKEQRFLFKRKQLSRERQLQLESLGFKWDPHGDRWETKFAMLQAKLVEDREFSSNESIMLTKWLNRQRCAFQKGRLAAEREARLLSLGIRLEAKNAQTQS
ncbi:hypothetical protein FVE85_7456 [Porphyridium purpureum]|uniref:Helicase-associated domain-containing protein n=1 Tax=Porphyridium purpureum TaxID=35688 RepID=A0A5J4Z7E0_PORPP|nr:hypothetical protein FVE85_7456 [Porphyridium purpureum]|eukprot:POR7140..scf295_1